MQKKCQHKDCQQKAWLTEYFVAEIRGAIILYESIFRSRIIFFLLKIFTSFPILYGPYCISSGRALKYFMDMRKTRLIIQPFATLVF